MAFPEPIFPPSRDWPADKKESISREPRPAGRVKLEGYIGGKCLSYVVISMIFYV